MTDEQVDFLLRQMRDGERLENILRQAYQMGADSVELEYANCTDAPASE